MHFTVILITLIQFLAWPIYLSSLYVSLLQEDRQVALIVGGQGKPHVISLFCHCAVSWLPETVKSPATRTLRSCHVRMVLDSLHAHTMRSMSLPPYEKSDVSVIIPGIVCNV